MKNLHKLWVYSVEDQEGHFLGFAVHYDGKWFDLPADGVGETLTATPEEPDRDLVDRCLFEFKRRSGKPSIEAMEHLIDTLERMTVGGRSHDCNVHRANLRLCKEKLESGAEPKYRHIQAALVYTAKASDFIASCARSGGDYVHQGV